MSSSALERFERWRESEARQELQKSRQAGSAAGAAPRAGLGSVEGKQHSSANPAHKLSKLLIKQTQPHSLTPSLPSTSPVASGSAVQPSTHPLAPLSESNRRRSMPRSDLVRRAEECTTTQPPSSAQPSLAAQPRTTPKRSDRTVTASASRARRSSMSHSRQRPSSPPGPPPTAHTQPSTVRMQQHAPHSASLAAEPVQPLLELEPALPVLAFSNSLAQAPPAPQANTPPPPPRPARSQQRSPIQTACFAHLAAAQTALPIAVSGDPSFESSSTYFACEEPPATFASSPSTATATHRGRSPILPGGWSALPHTRAEPVTAEAGVAAAAAFEAEAEDENEWARQRRLSDLMAGLGVVLGTTAFATTAAVADEGDPAEEDNSSSSPATTPENDTGPRRPVSGTGGLLEELRFTSEEELLTPSLVSSSRRGSEDRASESFESAEEGDDGVWAGQQRKRLSRKTSNLPTIHDTSPDQQQSEDDFEGPSAELAEQPIPVSFGYALDGEQAGSRQSSLGADSEEGLNGATAGGSAKQNVRESWRLPQRDDDGLGLSFEMLSNNARSPGSAHSLYTPSARPPIARNPTSSETIQLNSSHGNQPDEFPFPHSPALPSSASEPKQQLKSMLEVVSPFVGPVSPPLVSSPAVLRVKTSFTDLRKTRSRQSTPGSPGRTQLTPTALEAHAARTSGSPKSTTFVEPESPSGMTRSPSGITRSPSGSIRRKLSLREPRSRETSTVETVGHGVVAKSAKRLSSLFSLGRSASKDDIPIISKAKPAESDVKTPRRRAATEVSTRAAKADSAPSPVTPARPSPRLRPSKQSPSAQLPTSPFDSIPEHSQAAQSHSPPHAERSHPPSQASSRPSSLVGSGASSRRSSMASSHASFDLQIPVRAGSMLPQAGPMIPPRRVHDEQEVLLVVPAPSPSSTAPPLSPAPFMARTWRSTVSGFEYEALADDFGPVEMRRQEVIWELCETERSFVTGLGGVLDVFARPKQTRDGDWDSDVPQHVSRLLDWLKDIVSVHSSISRALEQLRQDPPRGLVQHIATALLPFVDKLEVHQPYLVKFESVTKSIDEMTADPDSRFGEFVRTQSALPECASLSLSSFLLKPVQRLMKYPLFFKQLAELTPPSHRDHLDMHRLLSRTDFIIRAMQELKTREDEYEHAKLIQASIRNLPHQFKLPDRARRLLHHGQLRRVHVTDRDRAALEMDALARSGQSPSPTVPASLSKAKSSKNGRPVSAGGARPSIVKKNSFTTVFQTNENGTPRFSPQFPSPNLSAELQLNSPQIGPFRRVVKTKAKESSVYLFVFSDLVLLATKSTDGTSTPSLAAATRFGRPSVNRTASTSSATNRRSSGGPELGPTYKLVDSIGLSRVVGVSDLSGKTEHEHLIELHLLPLTRGGVEPVNISSLSLAASVSSSTPQPPSVFLTLPERVTGSPAPSPRLDSPLKDRYRWVHALERSYAHAISFSGMALNSFTAPVTQDEWREALPRSASEHGVRPALASASTASSASSSLTNLTDREQERARWNGRLDEVKKEMAHQQLSPFGGWGKAPARENGASPADGRGRRSPGPQSRPRAKSRTRSSTPIASSVGRQQQPQPVEGLGIVT